MYAVCIAERDCCVPEQALWMFMKCHVHVSVCICVFECVALSSEICCGMGFARAV